MNTIKFLPNNQVLLNNKTLLIKITNVKYYNKIYKQYLHLPTVYTIKNNNYA